MATNKLINTKTYYVNKFLKPTCSLWIYGSTVFFFHRAFTGKLVDNKKKGTYRCTVCGKELFLSDAKFDSGSGWPSFWETSKDGSVREILDRSYGMTRTEVTCADVSTAKPVRSKFEFSIVAATHFLQK